MVLIYMNTYTRKGNSGGLSDFGITISIENFHCDWK